MAEPARSTVADATDPEALLRIAERLDDRFDRVYRGTPAGA
jgi:hypothetical protein